ncbi:hypothetical protein CHL_0170 [Campylobacter hyointestinalis subsp. lawsonii CCUG 27631]|uniref:hypothetical protein n=1 Tax=Campylobacter hyointestinalis TaxID=198 RepID=UPI0007C90155|nr:hypothetical protein [Campylobacter hyointestinalis]ANE33555.1 hypothetical protein CHL_0170 [Campylobacter hyointestinalis subsp. lawsonii CCUG 27631]
MSSLCIKAVKNSWDKIDYFAVFCYSIYKFDASLYISKTIYVNATFSNNSKCIQINFIPMNSELIKRKHYNISDDYDLGLEPALYP